MVLKLAKNGLKMAIFKTLKILQKSGTLRGKIWGLSFAVAHSATQNTSTYLLIHVGQYELSF